MPPEDADLSFVIDFKKGEGNPRRVFDAASLLIDAFEELDAAVAQSVDAKIQPLMVLEDVEAGSIKVYLKNLLKRVDDGALKDLDWKKQIGKYLVKAKYLALEWLDNESASQPSLSDLREGLRKLAEETDVRQLPDYPPVHEGRLVTALDRIQGAKRQLEAKDRLIIETDDRTYEVDLTKTWEPSEVITAEDLTETTSEGEIILTIRKPDFIKDTMWQFTHGKSNISAPVHDGPWLQDFHDRKIVILPGDALKCRVKFTYYYDAKGDLIDQKTEIVKVLDVLKGSAQQLGMFDDKKH